MGRLNLWGGGQVVPIMYVDAHGRVKWFWGQLWCGVLGTKSGFWPVAVFGPLKPFLACWALCPWRTCLDLTLAWHFGSMTLEGFFGLMTLARFLGLVALEVILGAGAPQG